MPTAFAVSGSGDVNVTGWGNGDWSGPAGELPWHPYSGNSDLFVLNLNSSGAYKWHTFFGSSSVDEAYGIAIDGSGNLYVTGSSLATWNGPANQPPLNALSGNGDFFVLKMGDQAGQVAVARILRGETLSIIIQMFRTLMIMRSPGMSSRPGQWT